MLRYLVVLALAAVAAGGAVDEATGYTRTPNGLIPTDCVHEVPHDAVVEVRETHSFVTVNGLIHAVIPHCDTHNGTRRTLIAGSSLTADDDDLPYDYDGWEEYTAWEHQPSLSTFNGNFSVPDIPKRKPDILYIFTGLQNINWIPKVDHQPQQNFDIIQPVLQYPASSGSGWSVKSWYVTLQAGAFYSTEVPVSPGDSIYGIMEREGADQYLVSSVVNGKTSSIHPKNSRLAAQPWAYNTLECYGCEDCSTYPTQPTKFTGLKILDNNSKPVEAVWVANPKPATDRKCHEAVTITDASTVTIFFDKQ